MSSSKYNLLNDLFLKHANELSSFIRHRWPKEQEVDDIVQESFLRLSQSPNPEIILNPRAFLFTTDSNVTIDRHRRRSTRDRYIEACVDLDNFDANHFCPARLSEVQEALEYFTHWLDELPELQRHAFVLFRIEGYAHTEIAVRLDISVSTSERYVKQAMRHISEHLNTLQIKD